MVKVTLEFKNADEAIVALGKLIGISNPPATAPTDPAPAASPAGRTRRPRSDAGKSRGSYTPRQDTTAAKATPQAGEQSGNAPSAVTDAGKIAEKAINPTSTVAQAPSATAAPQAPASVKIAAVVPTPEVVQAAVERLYAAKDFDDTLAVLSRFGVKKAKDLLPEHRADFIAKVEAVLAGGAI